MTVSGKTDGSAASHLESFYELLANLVASTGGWHQLSPSGRYRPFQGRVSISSLNRESIAPEAMTSESRAWGRTK